MLKQLSVIAIALLATQAHAAVAQPFVTLGLGQASVQEFCDENSGFGGVPSCDDTDTFFRLGAGVMLDPIFSAEVGYLNFGEASYTELFPSRGAVKATAEAQAIALQIGAYAPLQSNFSIYGKLGFAYTDVDIKAVGNGVGGSATASLSDSEFEVIFTAGAAYDFMPNFGATLQLDFIPNAGTEDTGESDLTAVSLGLKYQF